MRGKTILLAHGDREIASALAVAFAEEEYAVVAAFDAVQAVAAFRDKSHDLVVVTLGLPGGGGVYVHEQIRRTGNLTVPVIYIAGETQGPDIERARALGPAAILNDLMNAEDVLNAVRACLGGSPAEVVGPVNKNRLMRILVVDDEIEHCELIERGLQRPGREPIEMAFCHTVADACRLLEQERFGCVLLDHNLPDGHGTDILERMQDRLLTTPVIGLSTSRDPDVVIADFRGGCVEFIPKHEAFEGDTLRRQVFAAMASFKRRATALLIERGRIGRGVETSQEALAASARVDPVMGILNRAALEDVHQDLHKRMSAGKAGYACCLADLDNFKKYNDRYGHLEGDTALRAIAQALSSTLRADDFVARYGGEEIVILLSNVDEGDALTVAERLREGVFALNLPHELNAGYGRVTVSIGVAVFDPVTPQDKRAILERADQALYRAKDAGRNQVVMAGPAADRERRCA